MEIISTYTLGEFVAFSALLIALIIAGVRLFEFLNERFHFVETKKSKTEAKFDEMDSKIDMLLEQLAASKNDTNTLIQASISRIKGEIVRQHKVFMAQGFIDYKSLDYLQQQFKCYTNMGGNSYVHLLMDDLENLPIKD